MIDFDSIVKDQSRAAESHLLDAVISSSVDATRESLRHAVGAIVSAAVAQVAASAQKDRAVERDFRKGKGQRV